MATNKLSGKSIAITRPVAQANKLCALIEAAGGTSVLFPLIEITALENYQTFEKAIADLPQFDWVIFISSNAVQNGLPRILKMYPNLPENLRFAAIGPATAQEIQGLCGKQVLTPQGRFDSESLLALPEMQVMQGKRVMIIRGVGGREVLAETLKHRGAYVHFGECYRRINPQQDCDLLQDLYANNRLHGIVVTSSEAMRHLIDLAGEADWLKRTPIFVNHARVAELPAALGLQAHVAETGGDEAMLKLLQTRL